MRIKASNCIADANTQPVMVILSDQDKKNIANMHSKCTKYACFPDKWGTEQEMSEWMDEDSLLPSIP